MYYKHMSSIIYMHSLKRRLAVTAVDGQSRASDKATEIVLSIFALRWAEMVKYHRVVDENIFTNQTPVMLSSQHIYRPS